MRDGGDLIRAAIDDIQRLEQVGFLDERDLQRLLQSRGELVVGEEVGGIGHSHGQSSAIGLQYDRAQAARLHFRKQPHDGRVGRRLAHVDEGDLQVLRKQLAHDLLPDDPEIGQHASQLAAGAFLLRERRLQLLLRERLLFEQQLTEANLASADWLRHGRFRGEPGGGYSPPSLPCLLKSSRRSVGSFTSAGQSPSSTTRGRSRMTSSTVEL